MENYKKDFDGWNIEKKYLETINPRKVVFYERDIWWCSLGANLGSEQDGKNKFFERPVLVVRRFNSDMAWVVPITSKNHIHAFYYPLEYDDETNSLILSQMRNISSKRFRRFVRRISTYEFAMIKGRLTETLLYR